MSIVYSVGFRLWATSGLNLEGVSDIEMVTLDGTPFMIVGSEANNAVTVFSLADMDVPVVVSEIEYSENSGTNVLSDLTIVDNGTDLQVLTLGRYDNNYGLFGLANSGAMTLAQSWDDGSNLYSGGYVGASATVKGVTYVYSTNFGVEGFNVMSVAPDGSTNHIQTVGDTRWRFLDDVTVLQPVELHDTKYLVTGSGVEAGLHIFEHRNNGTMKFVDRLTAKDAGGLFGITDIASAEPGDRSFLVVASSETDSLTVIRVSEEGQVNEVDHIIDTAETRFGGVTEVETASYGGRSFVFAGGGDDGLAMFELDYRGKLIHLGSVADQFETSLANISALKVEVVGSNAHVYLGSASDHGVTEIIVDLDRSGLDLRGNATKDTLVGSDLDDVIWGMGKSDQIYGGDGNDRLIDGRGKDKMTGGAGADVFVFIEDGRNDFILDFEFGIDRIDLSEFDHLYHYSDLTIGARNTGGAIKFGDHMIRLVNPDGEPYDMDQLDQDDFIFI